MKISTQILGLVLITVFSMSCKNSDAKKADTNEAMSAKKEVVAAVKPQTATFNIEGMTCAVGCAKTIEEKLSETNGIQKAKVDFESKTAMVDFDLDKLSDNDLKKIVESCADGKTYKVSNIKLGNKS